MEKDDKHLDIKEKVEEHQERDQESNKQTEVASQKDVGNSQISNAGENKVIKKSKIRYIDFLFFGLVIACLIGVVYIGFLITDRTAQCVKNPFIYGASEMGNISCSCSKYDPICSPRFYFNDTSFDAPTTDCSGSYKPREFVFPQINFSIAE